MRGSVLVLLLACQPRAAPISAVAPAQPHASPHLPHFDPNASPQAAALVGRWRYGKNQPTDQGLGVDTLGHGASISFRDDGSYTQIRLSQTHPNNCFISIVEWEQGSWTSTGNAINL